MLHVQKMLFNSVRNEGYGVFHLVVYWESNHYYINDIFKFE